MNITIIIRSWLNMIIQQNKSNMFSPRSCGLVPVILSLITAPDKVIMEWTFNAIIGWLATLTIFMYSYTVPGHYCSSWGWQSPEIYDCFALPITCITPSSSMKARRRGCSSAYWQLDVSMFYDLTVWCLQEQNFPGRFQRINKSIGHSLYSLAGKSL